MTIGKSIPLYHLELVEDKKIPCQNMSGVDAAAKVFHEMFDRSPTEEMAVIHLGLDNQFMGVQRVGIGNLVSVQDHPSEILRGALVARAYKIIVGHNHPMGSSQPSDQDILFTKNLVTVASYVGLDVLDHIVIAPDGTHTSIYNMANSALSYPKLDPIFMDYLKRLNSFPYYKGM